MHDLAALQVDPAIVENLKLGDRYAFEQTSLTEEGIYEMFAESPRIVTFGLIRVINGIDILDTTKTVTLYRNGDNI